MWLYSPCIRHGTKCPLVSKWNSKAELHSMPFSSVTVLHLLRSCNYYIQAFCDTLKEWLSWITFQSLQLYFEEKSWVWTTFVLNRDYFTKFNSRKAANKCVFCILFQQEILTKKINAFIELLTCSFNQKIWYRGINIIMWSGRTSRE